MLPPSFNLSITCTVAKHFTLSTRQNFTSLQLNVLLEYSECYKTTNYNFLLFYHKSALDLQYNAIPQSLTYVTVKT